MSANGQTIDDTSIYASYDPASSWELDTSQGSLGVNNGTLHTTSTTSSSVTIRFTGTAISVYGLKSPTGANFTATLDSTSQGSTFNTSVGEITASSSAVIFSKDNLDNKEHILVISKAENDPNWTSTLAGDDTSHLNIDYFLISGSPISPSGTSTGSNPSESSSSSDQSTSSSSHSISTAAIVGIVLGVLAVLGLLAALVWYRWRRRRKAQYVNHEPFDSKGAKNGAAVSTKDVGERSTPLASTSKPAVTFGPTTAGANSSGEGQNRRYKSEKAMASRSPDGRNGPGISRWRSTLLALPGNRFIHVDSSRPENAPATNDNMDTDTATTPPYPSSPPTSPPTEPSLISSSTNPPSTSPLLESGTVNTPSSKQTQTRTNTNTNSSPNHSGAENQGRPRADTGLTTTTGMASSSPALSPSPLPLSSQESLRGEKGRHFATRSQPLSIPAAPATTPTNIAIGAQPAATAAVISTTSTDNSAVSQAGRADGSGTVTNHLLQEVAILREQVRNLTEMRHFGASSDVHHGHEEPPPEYEDRDSDEESSARQ